MDNENNNNNNKNIKNKSLNNSKFPLFNIYSDSKDLIKKKKLLMNRISAKKSRMKKKNYIKNLEEEIIKNKTLVQEKIILEKIYNPNVINKNDHMNIQLNNILTNYDYLLKKEKEIEYNDNDDVFNEYSNIQKKLLQQIINQELKLSMPIKCKLFAEKYLKLENFEEFDSYNVILNKIEKNISILKELYNFEENEDNKKNNKNNTNIVFGKMKKESETKAFQLFNYFLCLKEIIQIIINLNNDL